MSKRDQEEFALELLKALKAFDISSAEEECEKFLKVKSNIRNQIQKEVGGRKGPVQKCGFCEGCLRPDCGICRQCVDKKKFGGPGKLKEKCKMRSCSAQIQTRNLRKINKEVPRPANFVDIDSQNNNEVNAKHAALFAKLKGNANNGVGDVYDKIKGHSMEEEVKADITKQDETRPGPAIVDTNAGITNLHVPGNVIIDDSMLICDGGQMWNKEDKLKEDEKSIKDTGDVIEASDNTSCAEVEINAKASVEEAEHELVAMDRTKKMENDLIIENSFHGQLIGLKGKDNEKIHEDIENVQISFPDLGVTNEALLETGVGYARNELNDKAEKMENEKEKDEIQKIQSKMAIVSKEMSEEKQLNQVIKTDHDYARADEGSREAMDREIIKADHDYVRSAEEDAEEDAVKADYTKVLGSAVKPILLEGMSNTHSVV